MTTTPTARAVLAGRYELTGEVLATGGMGAVLAAYDRVLNRAVAVKMLHADEPDDAARKRFMREALTAAKIAHPNAIAIYDAGEHEGRPYIVMERLPGHTFAEEIARGPVTPVRARRIGCEVLGVLAEAHRLGVLHRDVKPHNILIDGEGSARVGDFGIAKVMADDATRTRELLGTPAYVAPELFEGHAATPQSDIFAVGVMLYEALSGKKPFSGDSPWAVAARMRHGAYIPIEQAVPWVDAGLAAAVAKALSPDPSQRFADADEMAEALRCRPVWTPPAQASAGDATAVMPPPTVTTPQSSIPAPPATEPTPATRVDRAHPARTEVLRGVVFEDEVPRSRRRPLALLAALLFLTLAAVLAVVAFARTDSPLFAPPRPGATPPGAAGADVLIPEPLRDEIDALERAVEP